MQSISKIPGRYYLAIFVLAFATLSYQILITRFFSVMLHYHFAFAAISLAMLGLTRGAMEVYGKPARYAAERVGIEFARRASWFALSSVGAMIVFLCVPLVVSAENVLPALALATIAFVAPFTEGGVCITLLLTRLPYRGGWLYAADLLGAAVGCLGVIFILLVIDPVSATLWIGTFAAGVGWIVVRTSDDVRSVRLSGAVALTLAVAATVHSGLDLTGRSHLGVFWAKGAEQTGTLFERWNTYSRVRVRELAEKVPIGWGLVRTPDARVDQHHLDIDADAGTVITRYDGDIGKLAYLKDDVINAAYLVQPAADVAVVGVGGGRDILSGLLFGASRIRAIEINPAIFEVLTEKFANFSGHLDRQPGVSLVNAEARSYINHSSERYDLVQISLIDTWAATVAGGLTLTENRLYTVEAWDDFYRALNPGGLLSVSRWYRADNHRGELYRLIAIAASALQRRGVSAGELRHHVVAVNVGNIVTVITRPDAFSDAEWQGVRERLQAQSFKILLGPDVTLDAVTSTLLSDKADQAFFDSLPENVTASTDDNPFFFYTSRFSDFVSIHSWDIMSNNVAIGIAGLLIIVSLCACGYYVVLPFLSLARRLAAEGPACPPRDRACSRRSSTGRKCRCRTVLPAESRYLRSGRLGPLRQHHIRRPMRDMLRSRLGSPGQPDPFCAREQNAFGFARVEIIEQRLRTGLRRVEAIDANPVAIEQGPGILRLGGDIELRIDRVRLCPPVFQQRAGVGIVRRHRAIFGSVEHIHRIDLVEIED